MGNAKAVPVDMYQPLNAQPGNSSPPQSNSMLDTAVGECDVVKCSQRRRFVAHLAPHTISDSFRQTIWIFRWGKQRREMKNVYSLRWTSETEVNNYCGWLRGTSSTRSGGYSNSSGLRGGWKGWEFFVKSLSPEIRVSSSYSCPLAERTRGRMSKSDLGGFHPSLRQTWEQWASVKESTDRKKLSVAYVRDFHIHRVSGDGSVGIQVARIRNQLKSEQNALIGFAAGGRGWMADNTWGFQMRKSCLPSVLCGKMVIADLQIKFIQNHIHSPSLLRPTVGCLCWLNISSDCTTLRTFAKESLVGGNQTPVDVRKKNICAVSDFSWDLRRGGALRQNKLLGSQFPAVIFLISLCWQQTFQLSTGAEIVNWIKILSFSSFLFLYLQLRPLNSADASCRVSPSRLRAKYQLGVV